VTVETAIPVEAPSREKTTADVLRHAARIIEERGWCRGELQDNQGAVCAWGAIDTALAGGVRYEVHDEERLALQALGASLGISWSDVPFWNDHPHRTAAEVIAALRDAADAAEARS
jgi:hypothetical protein